MLIFFFKIDVNFPQLLYFVVLAAVKGDYWSILKVLCSCFFALKTNFVTFPYKSFKFWIEQIVWAPCEIGRRGKRDSLGYAWFNFTCYHPLPPPPGNPGDKSSPSVPGVGNCLKPSCPRGEGAGQIKITSYCSCEVRHFSVDATPHGEDCLFPGRISRICNRLVREE